MIRSISIDAQDIDFLEKHGLKLSNFIRRAIQEERLRFEQMTTELNKKVNEITGKLVAARRYIDLIGKQDDYLKWREQESAKLA